MDDILKKLYYDPKIGLGGIEKLYKAAKQLIPSLKKTDVKEFIDSQTVSQVFKERKIKHDYPLIAYSPFSRVQIDLLDINDYNPNKNGGNKFIFLLIDVFSRVALGVPQKSKTDKECLQSLKLLLKDIDSIGYRVKTIDSDNESAFKSKIFSSFCKENDIIQHLNDPGDHKALGVIDRFCRTIRNLITRYQEAYQTQKFIPVLQDLFDNYNNSVNRNLKQSPLESLTAGGATNYMTRQKEKASTQSYNKIDYQIGDRVRVLKRKTLFQKGGNSFSKAVYTIIDKIDGRFYVEGLEKGYKKSELLKVDKREKGDEASEIIEENNDYEKEVEAQKVEKRVNRRINAEGLNRKDNSSEQEVLDRATRRYRKPRDTGPFVRSGK